MAGSRREVWGGAIGNGTEKTLDDAILSGIPREGPSVGAGQFPHVCGRVSFGDDEYFRTFIGYRRQGKQAPSEHEARHESGCLLQHFAGC